MIITFCGHSQFKRTESLERRVLEFLENKIGNEAADIYVGEYGDFDRFAYDCCKKYKHTHKNISLIFVTPYMTEEYQKNHLIYQRKRFDSIIYPPIETVPPKLAILYRNRYMIDMSDYVIAYVSHSWGGAYQAYKYAKRKKKIIFNLANFRE